MDELVVIRRKIVARKIPPELLSKRAIIQHFKDLANIGNMLEEGALQLAVQYRKRLHSIGWSYKEIYLMEDIAYSRTNWEVLLPHIHTRGSMTDWLGNRHRWTK